MAEHSVDEGQEQGLLAYWQQTQPLRLWLYGIAVPLLAALVGYGLLSGHHSALWLAVVQAALLGAGTETARQYVTSPATANRAIRRAAWEASGGDEEVEDEVARLVRITYRIPT